MSVLTSSCVFAGCTEFGLGKSCSLGLQYVPFVTFLFVVLVVSHFHHENKSV